MNKDFERCCSFLADMIIKYAQEIKEEVEMCMNSFWTKRLRRQPASCR